MKDRRYYLWGLLKTFVSTLIILYIVFFIFKTNDFKQFETLTFFNIKIFGFRIFQIEECIIIILGIICAWDSDNENVSLVYMLNANNYFWLRFLVFWIGLDSLFDGYSWVEYFGINFLFISLIQLDRYKEIAINGLYAKTGESRWLDLPLENENGLTENQKKALEKLEACIGNCNPDRGFTIVFEGEWGIGKTSVINAFNDRQRQNYIIIRVDAQTIGKAPDIMLYVNNYIEDLFDRYGIGFCRGFSTIFHGILKESIQNNVLEDVFLSLSKKYTFIDIKKEQQFLADKINILLSRSNKKNIILIIDDADRVDIQGEIIKALNQYSTLRGISSIIILNSLDDIIKDKEQYWQKYIFSSIKLEKDNNVIKEKSIREYIVEQNDSINHILSDNDYIYTRNMGERSLFSEIALISYKNDNENWYMETKKTLMLFEIFMKKFKNTNMDLSSYLSNLIKQYYLETVESKELFSFIDFESSGRKWLLQLMSISQELFRNLIELISILDNMENSKEQPKVILNDYKDLHMYNAMLSMPIVWEPSCKYNQGMVNPDYAILEKLVLEDGEIYTINNCIKKMEYKKAKDIFLTSAKKVGNFFYSVELIFSFWDYLNEMLSNMRNAKIVLINAEQLKMNFLEYTLEEWEKTGLASKLERNINNISPIVHELGLQWKPCRFILENILYVNYIQPLNIQNGKKVSYDYNNDSIVEAF